MATCASNASEVGIAKGASASLIQILYCSVIGLAVYSVFRIEERIIMGWQIWALPFRSLNLSC